LGLLAVGTGCADTCEIEAPLDYTDDTNWLCRPGVDGACAERLDRVHVAPDGTTTTETVTAAEAPPLACVAVYPTLAPRLRATLHHDLSDREEPARWAHDQAGPLFTACDLWVPVYRQVTIGTYFGRVTDRKEGCFDSAYQDVLAAFEAFVEAEPDKGIVLF